MRPANFSQWRVFYTLVYKECLRFLSVSVQTIVAPVVNASLYLLVFGVSLGQRISLDPSYSYIQFIVPGLIIMATLNHSFANTSSSLFQAKYIGYILDYLVLPVRPWQFAMAFVSAAMLRGLLVGFLVWLITLAFTKLPWPHPFLGLLTLLLTSFLFAVCGILVAFWARSFDHLSVFTNFIIAPLIYMGGLFYPVSELPSFWRQASSINPIYYMIDNFRYAALGNSDHPYLIGLGITSLLALVLSMFCFHLVHHSYKLRN